MITRKFSQMTAVGCMLYVLRFRQHLFTRYMSYFSNCDISNRLVTRLDELGVKKLTNIQEKAREQAIIDV